MPLPHRHNMSVRRTKIKILTKDHDIFATHGVFLPQPAISYRDGVAPRVGVRIAADQGMI